MDNRTWLAALCALTLALGCADDSMGDGDSGTDAGDTTMDAGGEMGDGGAEGCGDGIVDRVNEVCDDGNTEDGDGCRGDCQSDETCGNETTDTAAGEVCDDGNTEDGDDCSADCSTDYTCGNGVLDSTASGGPVDEVCDDGNTVNGDGCSADCLSDESCGNSIVDLGAGEVCDDGNTEDGDDCSADCMTSLLCGNGVLDGVEECDDGNTDPGDGCSASCRIERCGNGMVDMGEDCDDGNADDTDGCTAECEFTCSADADCEDADLCNGAETCSDAGTDASSCNAGTPLSDGDSCGSSLVCSGGSCVSAGCGDGFVTAPEECDDINTTNGDGCDNDCTYTCSADSDCDDGEACNGDETCAMAGTASSACMDGAPLMDGTDCGGGDVCRGGTCTSVSCGDGTVDAGEDCDDGNTANGDGCDNDCSWTCTSNADCDDGDVCNGAERCRMPSSLGSECRDRPDASDGTDCGGGNICRGGACVMPRCGDGVVSGIEDCDDMNTAGDDGCENDCTWTCASDADCDDLNGCTGDETCSDGGTLSSRCNDGTPPMSGTVCDADMDGATRDVCNMMTQTCALSECGDGVVDTGATPPEECDDGGTAPGDGCDSTCQMEAAVPPSAFRITELDLVSPRIVVYPGFGSCQDITDDCYRLLGCRVDSVNTQLATAVDTTASGGSYSLHIAQLFTPLNPSAAMSPTDIHLNPECVEGPPETCGPDPVMPDVVSGSASNMTVGTCYSPVAAEVDERTGALSSYSPTANTVTGPCFSTDVATLTVVIADIVIPLSNVTISATYSGTPPSRLVSGVITGFLSSDDAVSVVLPMDLDFIGGQPLYNFLQAGNTPHMGEPDACDLGGDPDDRETEGGVPGFRFFLNFEADEVTWTP